MLRVLASIVVCCALTYGFGPAAAFAQEPEVKEIRNDLDTQAAEDRPPEYDKATWPEAVVERPVTLAAGMFEIRGSTLLVSLSSDSVAEPISFAPSLYYGITDWITVGLNHRGVVPNFAGPGICVTGSDGGCREVYNNVGLDSLWRFVRKRELEVAARVGVEAASFDPSLWGARLGFAFKAHSSKFAIVIEPSMYVALNDREEFQDVSANPDWLDIGAELQYQASPALEAHLLTGVNGPRKHFSDVYNIPIGIGATFNVTPAVDVGLDLVFPNLLGADYFADQQAFDPAGGDLPSRSDFRTLSFRVALRF